MKIIFVADQYIREYPFGGAELTTEAILKASKYPIERAYSHLLTIDYINSNKNAYWIFGNFYNIKEEILLYLSQNIKYSVLEYDYKYCVYRSSEIHKLNTNADCSCDKEKRGKIVSIFFNMAKNIFWMSEQQKNYYISLFPFLVKKNNIILSSIFDLEDLQLLKTLDTSKKNDNWIILGSSSKIKGVENSIKYAKENNLNFEIINNLPRKELLEKLAYSRGLIFQPLGKDTCPRLVIEAKLLNCELILNNNVQHGEEKWFKSSKEEIISYLSNRTSVFWEIINNDLDFKSLKKNKFLIVVPFYNVEKWIEKNFASIKNQTYENFECIYIDDMSNDKSLQIINSLVNKDLRFKIISNNNKAYALKNIYDSIKAFCSSDEDIIVTLDGDDWLADNSVLEKLNNVYNKEKCWLTYGSYIEYPSGNVGKFSRQIPNEIIKNNSFRNSVWQSSHLRTFKFHLWNRINLKDLLDEENNFYKVTWDMAFMMPMLEMASEKSYFIPDILYVYNRDNPINDDKLDNLSQILTEQKIRNKNKYSKINYVTCNILGPEKGNNFGLGNQLFCIATTLSYAKKHNLYASFSQIKEEDFGGYDKNIFKFLPYENINSIDNIIKENSFIYNELEYKKGNLCLNGYFQSYKYFNDNWLEIEKYFNINEYIPKLLIKYQDIKDRTSLHIRRGDYLNKQNYHNIVKLEYYKEAVKIINPKKLAIFSDDIEWCKNNLLLCDDQIYIENNHDYEDLILMSICKNNIIANSTFSWWAAWMNKNKNKIITAPNEWFGKDYNNLSTKDIIPNEWIKI